MTNDDIGDAENAQNFYCKKCDVNCSKLSDWRRHISTRKHKNDDKMIFLVFRWIDFFGKLSYFFGNF